MASNQDRGLNYYLNCFGKTVDFQLIKTTKSDLEDLKCLKEMTNYQQKSLKVLFLLSTLYIFRQ